MFEAILTDLKGRYGAKVLLSPDDLVEVIGISVGQQANLRSKGMFPIPTKKVGALVKVSIYDLAKYLSGVCSDVVKHEARSLTKTDDKPLPRLEKKKRRGQLEKGWWLDFQQSIYPILDKSFYAFRVGSERNVTI